MRVRLGLPGFVWHLYLRWIVTFGGLRFGAGFASSV
jgi:hypothetical protein